MTQTGMHSFMMHSVKLGGGEKWYVRTWNINAHCGYLPCNIFLPQIGLKLQCFSEETNMCRLKARNPRTLAAFMMVNAFVSISGLGSTLETSTDAFTNL